MIGADGRGAGYGSLCWMEFEVGGKPLDPYQGRLEFDTWDTFVMDPYGSDVSIKLYDGIYGFLIQPPPPPPPSPLIGTQTVYLPSMSNRTLIFLWNTTGIPLGNYTVRAVAIPVEGEVDVEDNTFVDGTVEVLWVHDIAVTCVSSS